MFATSRKRASRQLRCSYRFPWARSGVLVVLDEHNIPSLSATEPYHLIQQPSSVIETVWNSLQPGGPSLLHLLWNGQVVPFSPEMVPNRGGYCSHRATPVRYAVRALVRYSLRASLQQLSAYALRPAVVDRLHLPGRLACCSISGACELRFAEEMVPYYCQM